jgi:long-chain acyl-CoA synthetase
MAINTPAMPVTFAGSDTPARVFRMRCAEWGERSALRRKVGGLWQSISWQAYYHRARAVGLALTAQGLVRHSVVCVLAENRPEWLYIDMGAQCMGLVGNGIYPTSSPEQVFHILHDSGAQALFVENQEQLEKALAVRTRCPALRLIVVMDRKGLRNLNDADIIFFDDFLVGGERLAETAAQTLAFEQAIDAGAPDDLAFLVYTSGTTGAPKGAMISNRNVVFQITQAASYLDVILGDRSLSFLPLCHIAERMASVFNPLAVGLIVHFPENAGTVVNDLREVAPHVVFAPPRFWEKMVSQIDLTMRDAIRPARWVYAQAREQNRAVVESKLDGASSVVPDLLGQALQWLAFRNIRRSLGLQNIKSALTGAAPVPPDLIRWYLGMGIELREAFGMTETSGFCTATPPGKIRLGRAGVRATGTDIRIGANDEIQVRGPNVFAGYWNNPVQTAGAIDADGWLHTGDCGAVDAGGYLSITGRIKDILITSGGKNITPSHIENLIKFSPYVTDAVVIGDGRNFLTCLVMIDHEHVAYYAQEQQVPYTDFASLSRAVPIVALLRGEIERINSQLARAEQIKDFRLIGELLTAEDEELTPTMKLKRKVVASKYKNLIDEMYPR